MGSIMSIICICCDFGFVLERKYANGYASTRAIAVAASDRSTDSINERR